MTTSAIRLVHASPLLLALAAACGGDDESLDGNGDAAHPENTSSACRDGLDNDDDGATDCADSDCRDFVFCAGADSDADEATGEDAGELGADDIAEDTGGDDEGIAEADSDAGCEPVAEDGCETTEICGDGLDNDCDGVVDEAAAGCTCAPGAFQRCYGGPPGRAGVGGCVWGWQACSVAEVGSWSECEGWIPPSEDRCDGKDNDCDGCPDQGTGCDPGGFACPDEVPTRPVRWYDLRCFDFYSGTGTCEWSVTPPLASRAGIPEDPRAGYTRFYMDVAGDYVVHVLVNDERGMVRECEFVVRARPPGLHLHVWWDDFDSAEQSNMNLHLHRDPPQTAWETLDDCYYNDCGGYAGFYDLDWDYADTPIVDCGEFPDESDWDLGSRGACPNPRLEQEGYTGQFDVETISLDEPNPGDRFRVAVHYDGRTGLTGRSSPAPANVQVWCGGLPIARLGPATLDCVSLWSGDWWRVADIEFDALGDACSVAPVLPLPDYDIQPNSSAGTF
ncbi:MAG: hypothetical protein JXB32_14235 [Deltaproteobacteria bacterium]|nr:hypothetical protein [Deltaproteobacteria bacterium]